MNCNSFFYTQTKVTGSGIKPKTNVGELFRNARNAGTYVKICAPMVRYSK